jgi:hypothetical protein
MAGEMANLVDYFTGLGREQGAILGEDVPSVGSEGGLLAEFLSGPVGALQSATSGYVPPLSVITDPLLAGSQLLTTGQLPEGVGPVPSQDIPAPQDPTAPPSLTGNAPGVPPKIPETPKEAADQSQVEAQQVRVQLQDQGASEEDLSAWDKFNGEFDLTTVGLMLMATAGNGQGLAANLGAALLKSKQMKQAQAMTESELAAAAREETREEREIRRKEADTASKLELDKAKYNKILAEIDDIKKGDPDDIEGFFTNKAALESITSFLEGKVDDPEGDTLIIATDADDVLKRARAAGLEGFSAKDALDMALKRRIAADPSSRDIPGVPFM